MQALLRSHALHFFKNLLHTGARKRQHAGSRRPRQRPLLQLLAHAALAHGAQRFAWVWVPQSVFNTNILPPDAQSPLEQLPTSDTAEEEAEVAEREEV